MTFRFLTIFAALLAASPIAAQNEVRNARLPAPTAETLTPQQKEVSEILAGTFRSPIPNGPFSMLLLEPRFAAGALEMFKSTRQDRVLDMRLFELMVLVVARHWQAHFEWTSHAGMAAKEGVAAEAIEAIRTNGTPTFTRDDEKAVYELVSELSGQRKLSQATFDRTVATLGREQTVELILATNFYTFIAMTVVAFDIPPAAPAPLKPLP